MYFKKAVSSFVLLISLSGFTQDLDCELSLTPIEKHKDVILGSKNLTSWRSKINSDLERVLKKGQENIPEENRIMRKIDGGIDGQDVEFISGLPRNYKVIEAGDNVFRHYSPNNKAAIAQESVLRAGARPFILPVAAHLRKEYTDLTGVFVTRPNDDPARLWLGYTEKTPHVDFRLPSGTKLLDFGDGNLLIIGPPKLAAWINEMHKRYLEKKEYNSMYEFEIRQFESRGGEIRYPLVVPFFLIGEDKNEQAKKLTEVVTQNISALEENFSLSEEYSRWYFQRRIEPTLSKPSFETVEEPAVLYRGMYLSLEQIKKILLEGMKTSEVQWTTGDKNKEDKGISFSSSITEAASYIFHNAHKKFTDGKGVGVIFRVRKSKDYELLNDNKLNRTNTIFKKYQDVLPEEIDEIYLWGEYGPEKLTDAVIKSKQGKLNPQKNWVSGDFNR